MGKHGQESEKESRARIFRSFQVNWKLFRPSRMRYLCIAFPHIAEKKSPPKSSIPITQLFQEAENRLHAQKAIMLELMKHEVADGLRSVVLHEPALVTSRH